MLITLSGSVFICSRSCVSRQPYVPTICKDYHSRQWDAQVHILEWCAGRLHPTSLLLIGEIGVIDSCFFSKITVAFLWTKLLKLCRRDTFGMAILWSFTVLLILMVLLICRATMLALLTLLWKCSHSALTSKCPSVADLFLRCVACVHQGKHVKIPKDLQFHMYHYLDLSSPFGGQLLLSMHLACVFEVKFQHILGWPYWNPRCKRDTSSACSAPIWCVWWFSGARRDDKFPSLLDMDLS